MNTPKGHNPRNFLKTMTNESINQVLTLDELEAVSAAGLPLWVVAPATGYVLYKVLEYGVDKLMESDSNVISSNADKANNVGNESDSDTGK